MFIHLFKKASIVLPALVFTACSTLSPAAPTPSAAEIEKEEQAVYSFFLSDAGDVPLILESTSSDISSDNPMLTIDSLKSTFKDVSDETMDSFIERNAQPTQLSADMDLGMNYVLLTSDELKRIGSQPNWGELLTQEYPGSDGYLIFSRVGFNNTLDQALIDVGNVGGPLVGSGSYYLMEKQNGKWTIKDELNSWIS